MKTLYTEEQIAGIENAAFTPRQIEMISQPTPESEIEIKTDEHGQKYKSVKASYAKRQLDLIFGFDYDFIIKSREYFALTKEVIVEGRLIIRSKKTITKDQFGGFNLNTKTIQYGQKKTVQPVNIANGYKAAGSDCLKKCASEIGLFWDVYGQQNKIEQIQPETKLTHEEQVVYDRLSVALAKSTTPEQIEENYQIFLDNSEEKQYHKDLLKSHLEMFKKKE